MALGSKNLRAIRLAHLILALLITSALIMLPFSIAAEKTDQEFETAEPAVRLAAGFTHSALIDYDGSLYLWGDNTYGQAAGGDESYIDQPQLAELDNKVLQVSLGAWHTLVLTDQGEVYSSGRNTFGQLGNGSWENSSELKKISGLNNITAIAAGSYHSMALDEDGSLWVWGNNTNNQLAHAQSEELKENDQVVARRTSRPDKIVDSGVIQIAAGGHFSLYLDENKKIFAFGDNSKGQLGDGTTESKDIPVQVVDIENVKQIAAGYEYAIAITATDTSQKIYSWGDNSLGQLGIGQSGGAGSLRSRPAEVNLLSSLSNYDPKLIEFSEISVGYAHVLMTLPAQVKIDDPETDVSRNELTGYHKLFVWGNNAFGQLGAGSSKQIYLEPTALEITTQDQTSDSFVPFDAIAAGGSHSLVMSSLGQLAAAGRGNRGQLGTVSIIDRNKFTTVETKDHILPAWSDIQTINAEFNNDDEIHIRWSPAQNNRSETMYRLEIRTTDNQLQLLEAGADNSRVVKNLDPDKPLAFRVFAYDDASENMDEDQLSYLHGAYFPEEYDITGWNQDFDQPYTGAVQKAAVNQSWIPDPSGRLPIPAVPWEQPSAYDTSTSINFEDKAELPLLEIIIMVFSTITIVAAALWLANNFRKERFLLYPLHIPAKVKRIWYKAAGFISRIGTRVKSAGKTVINSLPFRAIKAAFASILRVCKALAAILKSRVSKRNHTDEEKSDQITKKNNDDKDNQ